MSSYLLDAILGAYPEISGEKLDRIFRFQSFLALENEKQNLSRLTSEKDFFEGHFIDVMELEKSGWITGTAMDLGSGCGVPGLLSSILSERPWILCESEGNKARFLEAAAEYCGISSRIEVVNARAENFLQKRRVDFIVARAVGPVLRIMGWVGECSTWNKMVLFKGPGWTQEWTDLGMSKHRKSLLVSDQRTYFVGEEKKSRILVMLDHVPRGTVRTAR